MRRKLTLMSAAITSMVVIAFLVPLALVVRQIASDRAVNAAELEAQSLIPTLAAVEDPETLKLVVEAADESSSRSVTVFLEDGATLGEPGRVERNVRLARLGRAFEVLTDRGVDVLVPVTRSDGSTAVVRVGVPRSMLYRGVATAWSLLAGLGLALIFLAIFVADRMARNIIRPIRELASAAQRLGYGDLEVRVEPQGSQELVEVGRAFNRLASRIRGLLTEEREAAADLSHRLRTQVAALRLNSESLRDPAEAARVIADIDELERAVDRVIQEVRRPVREGVGASTDLGETARARVAFWAALADDQGRPYRLEVVPGSWPVRVAGDDLAAVLDALLGNVFAHTPDGTPFSIEVGPGSEGRVCLTVEDQGAGLPDGALVERGISGSGSTGLGLDIVGRTARVSGGTLRFARRAGGGARVEVEFGAAES